MEELILEGHEVCPHSSTCVYHKQNNCWGANGMRENKFYCTLVDTQESGGGYRNPMDKTGRMEVIID
ncbi:MAG: hypothetical protein ACTSVO_13530 [Candidatus Heimdallarchaeaceae archaeon]